MLPDMALMVLGSFAPMFTRPVWEHVQVLVTGAILCRGPHTVAGLLRTLGLADREGVLQIPPGVEQGAVVGLAWVENPAGAAGCAGHPPWISVDHLGGRNRGAAEGQEDQGQGVLPGRDALDAKQSGEVLRAEMDLPDGAGSAAVEPSPVGAAVPDRSGPVAAGVRIPRHSATQSTAIRPERYFATLASPHGYHK